MRSWENPPAYQRRTIKKNISNQHKAALAAARGAASIATYRYVDGASTRAMRREESSAVGETSHGLSRQVTLMTTTTTNHAYRPVVP